MASRITKSTHFDDQPGATLRSTKSGRRGHTVLRVEAALFCLLMAAGLSGAEPPHGSRAALRQVAKRGPTVDGDLPLKVHSRLRSGYRTALKKIHWVKGCQDLFTQLGADGIETLGNTTYTLARADWEKQVCTASEAFTTVGGSKVWLCGHFSWISENDAALVLLHEALHSAGLGEQPRDPDGPTPAEIDHMVVTRCGF